jgi:hypothetical protein
VLCASREGEIAQLVPKANYIQYGVCVSRLQYTLRIINEQQLT